MTTATPTFNAGLAMLDDYLDTSLYPARLHIRAGQPLYAALTSQDILPEEHLLGVTWHGRLHVFPMKMVLCYNVIEGVTDEDEPWVMTFCNACNTGMVFDARVNGEVRHFQRRGAYDGMLLIWDEETGSYWQHITGECLHGVSVGTQLLGKTVTRHLTAAEAVLYDPNTVLWSMPLTPEQEKLSRSMERMRSAPERVAAGIVSTFSHEEDTRRPRFELGLVVWDGAARAFFPVQALGDRDNVALSPFNGQTLLVYRTPDAMSPVALYTDATKATWSRDTLVLDNGQRIHNDMLYGADGEAMPPRRPMQLMMRWYGAAATFTGCDVWEG